MSASLGVCCSRTPASGVTATTSPSRVSALTGLRAVAALLVVGTHAAFATGKLTHGYAGAIYAHLEVGVAIFFVTIGLMLNPAVMLDYAWPIAVITLAVIVGKIVSCGLGTFLAGRDARTSMRVGMTVSQIGEFSFIIASLGLTLKVTSAFLYPIAVAVSALTKLPLKVRMPPLVMVLLIVHGLPLAPVRLLLRVME